MEHRDFAVRHRDLIIKSSLFRAGSAVGNRIGTEDSAMEIINNIFELDAKIRLDKYAEKDVWIESMYAHLRSHGVKSPLVSARL